MNIMEGIPTRKKTRDMGVDGKVRFNIPIQVKASLVNISRNVIDEFKSVIQREKVNVGVLIAYGFSKNSIKEVKRIYTEENIRIFLVEFSYILKCSYFSIHDDLVLKVPIIHYKHEDVFL